MPTPNMLALTTVTPRVLASLQLAAGDNTIYTAAANKAAKIATLTLCNTTSTPVIVSVSVVPSGSTVDGTHKVVSAFPLAANDSTVVTEVSGMWLGTGDFISVNASAATTVDAVMTGIEFA